MPKRRGSAAGRIVRRFFVPRFVVTLYHLARNRTKISPRAEVEFSHRVQLGPRCTVGSFTKIKAARGVLRTGRRCLFANGCFVSAEAGGIEMGDHVMCGPNVTIVSGSYGYGRLDVPFMDQEPTTKGVRIGSNVWIGAGTVILDGSQLGDNTIVVANSLVNRRFAPNTVLQGNPARVILKRQAPQTD